MIVDRDPLNMNEVQEALDKIPDSDKKEEVKIYLKKFLKAKPGQAKKIREVLIKKWDK